MPSKQPLLAIIVTFASTLPAFAGDQPKPFAPRQDVLPAPPPKGAIMLFDGKGINKFVSNDGTKINWPIKDGSLISVRAKQRTNHIVSTLHFRDADIHVEFNLPEKGSGNSGVYIHGHYEMQIFNSYGNAKLDKNGIGSLYRFSAPLVNAARKPGEWQVYDIRYHAPRRDGKGKITTPGKITAWLNGKKVQDNTQFGEPKSPYHPYRYGTTPYLQTILKNQMKTSTGPVFLQDHDNPVRFRNVWVRPLDDKAHVWGGR